MIETLYKAKLPKEFSFPVNNTFIDKHLSGAQFYDYLASRYSDKPYRFKSEFMERIKNKRDILVSELAYSKIEVNNYCSGNQHVEMGLYQPKWQIYIYPVPKEIRSYIKVFYEEDILPAMKNWLNSQSSDLHGQDIKTKIEFTFNLKSEKLKIIKN